MALPIESKRKSTATFNGILLIGLGILFLTNFWWPGILLVLGAALAARQWLRGRLYEMVLTSAVFGGLFLAALYNWQFSYVVAVLLTIAGIVILYAEWFVKRERVGEEKIEEANKEIEDAEHPE